MADMQYIEGFEGFTIEELELVLKGMGRCAGPKITGYEWFRKLDKYYEMRKTIKQKGVIIITKCGEAHHVEPTQDVKEIYVDGILVHSSNQKANKEVA